CGYKEAVMSWNIAQAKQQFSEVVRLSVEEPQMIYNRDRCVAAVIDAETFKAFDEWRKTAKHKTLGAVFAELRRIAAEDNYELPTLPRSATGRPNAFVAMLEECEEGAPHERAA
ncbi:MAG: hypothetical protein Q8J72_03025, partial [Rhodocyclaceae bacterium]|nr:hypothetical protein [Rhodocyclaceae bacterium]